MAEGKARVLRGAQLNWDMCNRTSSRDAANGRRSHFCRASLNEQRFNCHGAAIAVADLHAPSAKRGVDAKKMEVVFSAMPSLTVILNQEFKSGTSRGESGFPLWCGHAQHRL
jgi:hypothetical protein